MSWQTDDGKHEGWVAATFADGALGSGWGAPTAAQLGRQVRAEDHGVTVARIGDRYLPVAEWQYRPEAEVTGWVTACECGWRGEPWTRVTAPDDQDLAARRVYSPDVDGPQGFHDAGHAEWKEHIGPHEILTEIATLSHEHAEVGRRLAETVARARAGGASWAEVGSAAGMTRQSAHERWRSVSSV